MNYDEYEDYIYTDGFDQEIEEIVDERVKSKIQAVIDEYNNGEITAKENELKQLEKKLEYIKNDDKYNLWSNECVYLEGAEYSTDPKYIFRTKEEAEQALKEMEEK